MVYPQVGCIVLEAAVGIAGGTGTAFIVITDDDVVTQLLS
jgi:hypothetical protein